MKESFVLAVPSSSPGGLTAEISQHFGHCDFFTLISIKGSSIDSVDTVANVEHGANGCVGPVHLLRDKGVQAVVVGGLGARPMQACAESGIGVHYAAGCSLKNVEEAAIGFIAGKFPLMRNEHICSGNGRCH